MKVGLIPWGTDKSAFSIYPILSSRPPACGHGNRLAVPKASPWENLYMDSGYSDKTEFRNDMFGNTPLLVP